MARDFWEARELFAEGRGRLRLGFNYRYYPGIRKALQDARSGRFGKIITVELLLGHGCSPGQEKTWKLDRDRAGGGCLIDPGVHLLDICTLLAPGGLKIVGGATWSGFWNTGIEEDVNVILAADGFSINAHISIVHWRSEFRMAIHGTEGYGIVTGRNRSYGRQKYVTGPRWGWQSAANQAASEKTEVDSDGTDVFADEMEALLFCSGDSDSDWPRPATSREAMHVMELLDDIRQRLGLHREFRTVKLAAGQ